MAVMYTEYRSSGIAAGPMLAGPPPSLTMAFGADTTAALNAPVLS